MIGIESAVIPVGVLVSAAILHYMRGKRLGIGLPLLVTGGMFLLIKLGFQLLAEVIEKAGEGAIAAQLTSVSVYIGSLVGGACVLGGALLIALEVLLKR